MSQYHWNGEDWEISENDENDFDNVSSSLDPEIDEYYQQALCAEPGNIMQGIPRSWNDWMMMETPMTKDDILDMVVWIRNL